MNEPTPADVAPPMPRNDFAWVGLIVGIVAFGASLGTVTAWVPGALGVVFSAVGIGTAVRRDVGMARAVAGLLISLVALVVVIYTIGASRGGGGY